MINPEKDTFTLKTLTKDTQGHLGASNIQTQKGKNEK